MCPFQERYAGRGFVWGVRVEHPREGWQPGDKEGPVATIGKGLEAAKGRPVYACAEEFKESITLTSPGSALFGGLDCTNGWAYVGAQTKSALTGDADKVTLTVAKTASGASVDNRPRLYRHSARD